MKLQLKNTILITLLLSLNPWAKSAFAGEFNVTGNTVLHKFTTDPVVISTLDKLEYNKITGKETGSAGDVFNSTENLKFKGTYEFLFTNSKTQSYGGFIASSKELIFEGLKKLSFSNNIGNATSKKFGTPCLLYSTGDMSFNNVGTVEFINNIVQGNAFPAMIYTRGKISFNNIKTFTISGNRTDDPTKELYFIDASDEGMAFKNIGEMVLLDNQGTVLVAHAKLSIRNAQSVLFKNNTRGRNGGAVVVNSTLGSAAEFRIENSGKVEFLSNSSKQRGGAILAANSGVVRVADVFLSADLGDITFLGNTRNNGVNYTDNPILNAIQFYAIQNMEAPFPEKLADLSLRARTDKSIIFYDPIISSKFGDFWKFYKVLISLNNPADSGNTYDGIIKFDGSKVEDTITKNSVTNETDAAYQQRLKDSRYSDFEGDTTLYGGSLLLTNKVVFGKEIVPGGKVDAETSFVLKAGILDMTNESQLHAYNVTFSGKDAILRIDNTSKIVATKVDMSKGVSFDALFHLDHPNTGALIKTQNLLLGSTIGLADSEDYYTDKRFANTLTITLFDKTESQNVTGNFKGIQSNLTGDSKVDDPYDYNGEWTFRWEGNKLVATWNFPGSDGGIEDVRPELAGNIISNSMWSSISNTKAVSGAALGNANILRLESTLQSNYWMKGIGDFTHDDSSGKLDGYQYNGGGYAVGGDYLIKQHSILGFAFGNIYGDNKSELYNAAIKQDSNVGTIYAAHLQQGTNKAHSLLWTAAMNYGNTDNRLNTHYSNGESSHGTWNNTSYYAEAKATWRIAPQGKDWTYMPNLGIEFSHVNMGSFTETGDKARHFGKGKYVNLALPIGFGVEHKAQLGKRTWVNALNLAYVPDVYRESPNTQATRLSSGFTWKDQGSKSSIHAVRAQMNSTLQLNANWTTYAAYTFEARGEAIYHNVNAGVSYSF